MKNLILLLILSAHAYAENEHSVVPERTRGGATPALRGRCYHAALMRVHLNMLGEGKAAEGTIAKGDKEIKYVDTTEAAASKMMSYASADECDLVFAFRGTQEKNDVMVDLDATEDSSGRYHSGFLAAAKLYAPTVKAVLENNRCKENGGPRITFTGHSLGGAVAQTVANVVMRNQLPGKTEVIVFGAPRVVLQKALDNGKHADRFTVEHYFIDKDPVTAVPPAPLYADLTSVNHRFTSIPITKKEEGASALIQNHLPMNYVDKMDALCAGKETTTSVNAISHSVLEAAATTIAKVTYDFAKAETDKKIKEADALIGLLPATNSSGGKLPNVSEVIDTVQTYQRLNPSRGNPSVWGTADGASFARDEACKQWGLSFSTTDRGRAHFCNDQRTGFNENAAKYCATKCGYTDYATAGCSKGCADTLHDFCVKKWRCAN